MMPEHSVSTLLTNRQALQKKNAALDDVSTSSVWQAVKSFGNYSKCGV